MQKFPKIVIAGASGYIGHALIPRLLAKFPDAEITALSRSSQSSNDTRVIWRSCDLFSLKSLEEAVPEKVDLAFYLVHSMGPTAQLDQGSFADYDLILADNFARTLVRGGVKQVVYLGGLVPNTKELSLHLQSRLEVEETFIQAKLPVTVFRAGLVIGEAGSSFQILTKLVKRLPVMLCPRWTQTMTTPVDLETVLQSLVQASLDESRIGKIYDLAGCQSLTYVEMMRETASQMGKRRWFIGVPFFTPTLSGLWVSLITGASKSLVYPLVASLEHPMVARPEHLFSAGSKDRSYRSLLEHVDFTASTKKTSRPYQAQRKTVRSVQRLPLPPGRDAKWVTDKYVDWLPKFLTPFIKVRKTETGISFSLFMHHAVMLDLTPNAQRSTPDRQLLYITGGLLSQKENRGRLEFRVVLRRQFVLAAIHDFKPSLPWFAYKYTQAIIHLIVMRAFARYLRKRL